MNQKPQGSQPPRPCHPVPPVQQPHVLENANTSGKDTDEFIAQLAEHFFGPKEDTPSPSPPDSDDSSDDEPTLSASEVEPLLLYRYTVPRNIVQAPEELQKLVNNPEVSGPHQNDNASGKNLLAQGSQYCGQEPAGACSTIVASPFPPQTDQERQACARKIEELRRFIPYLKISIELRQDPIKTRKTKKLLDLLQHENPCSFNLPLHVLLSCENALKAIEEHEGEIVNQLNL